MSLVLIGIFVWLTVKQNVSADIANGSARISFLDVGQGDSALISLPDNKQILIDTGKSPDVVAKIKSKMPPFDNEIEKVFLSHPDNDHIGEMQAILNSFKVDEVYLNTDKSDSKTFQKMADEIKSKGIKQEVISSGRDIYEGELKIENLWPKSGESLTENNMSLVMLVQIKNSKALFTGDLEIEGQQKMLGIYSKDQLGADLYKVPHHGSAGAWNESFISAVGPKNAVISVGPNSYGHPTKTVLDGLSKLGINIYRTDESGTIDFVATDQGWVKK